MADRFNSPIDIADLSSAPSNPSAGYSRIYAKTDGKVYKRDSSGVETLLSNEIPNDAVTNAKLADMATKTYKGRTTAATGDPEDVPVATLKADLNLAKADVGLGNVDNTSDASKPVSTDTQTALNLKANLASPTFTGTVGGITKTMVGLTNVDNTSDATKNSASATLTNKTITDGVNTVTTPTTTSIGYLGMPQNSQSAAYELVLTDAGKHILHPSADTTARTFTIPANSAVAFPIGTAVTFINQNSGGVITIAITTDTMRLAGAGTTGSRTLAANGMATAVKVTATEWLINGVNLT